MIITLVGYRGSGKSSVAARLAERIGWRWIDADVELQRQAGRSIREIFAKEGEPFFRKLERELLADLLSRDKLVLAAGGGAVLHADTRRRMQTAGPVVWLRASVETLHKRVAADQTTPDRRPDLTPLGGRREMEALLGKREPLYDQCATLTIDTDGLSPEEVVDRIVAAVEADL